MPLTPEERSQIEIEMDIALEEFNRPYDSRKPVWIYKTDPDNCIICRSHRDRGYDIDGGVWVSFDRRDGVTVEMIVCMICNPELDDTIPTKPEYVAPIVSRTWKLYSGADNPQFIREYRKEFRKLVDYMRAITPLQRKLDQDRKEHDEQKEQV